MNKEDYFRRIGLSTKVTPDIWDRLKVPNTLPINYNEAKIPIYFDMDGTMAEFKYGGDFRREGYFRELKVLPGTKELFNLLLNNNKVDVRVASKSHYNGIQDKLDWLSANFPKFDLKKAIFIPLHSDKNNFIPQQELESGVAILIDDHSPNLRIWKGIPVNCLNGINKEDKFSYNIHGLGNTLLNISTMQIVIDEALENLKIFEKHKVAS